MSTKKSLTTTIKKSLQEGVVIPAHPLALYQNLKLDETSQRRLTRYYMATGAGGVAVGVHTTQFEIRDPQFNLLEPVLKMAAEEIAQAELSRPFIKVAGVCGPTDQALNEAELAVKHGYDLGLVSNGGLQSWTEEELIKRIEKISEIIPVFGFYLQPAAGGRLLSYEFWRDFVEIPNVQAIKVAAFNRYQTLDVVRAVCDSTRRNDIALYTGNDDNIIADLLTTYRFTVDDSIVEKKFVGGLLGHWAVWTKKSVELLAEIKQCITDNYAGAEHLLTKGIEVTDMNAVLFDAKNAYAGCIAGVNEILRRQGLMEGNWCLSAKEKLSPGQTGEFDRIYESYSQLTDDDFVREFLRKEKTETLFIQRNNLP